MYEQIMPVLKKKCNTYVKIEKCPNSCTLAPFYEHNMSISQTKSDGSNDALKGNVCGHYAIIEKR